MKKVVLIISLVFCGSIVGQSISNLELEKQILKQSRMFSDNNVLISSMYNIIALEGENSTYKDSLAYTYLSNRKYVSCFLVADDILKRNPDNEEMLEIKAFSLESVGALEKAIEAYQALLLKTNSNYHAYKIAGMQMGLKKFDEALLSVKKADELADTGKIDVSFQVNKNYNQQVNLKASIAYLEGLILINLEKNKEAKVALEKAVTLFPDFVLAKSKLTTLDIKE